MTDVARFVVGEVTLTRVPYFDVALDPAAASLTTDQVAGVDWAVPAWATPAGEVLIGQAVWVIETAGATIVVDPCGAADAFIRTGPAAIGHQEAVLAAMASAGIPSDDVDLVVLSHLDGIGMTAVVDEAGAWSPAFPSARIVLTGRELAFLAERDDVGGVDQLRRLAAQGVVEGAADEHELAPHVVLRLTAGHSPGHAVIEVASQGERAVLLGHLAVSPLNAAFAPVDGQHDDSPGAWAAFEALLDDAAADDVLVIGPLWPYPGAGFVTADRRIVPATPDA